MPPGLTNHRRRSPGAWLLAAVCGLALLAGSGPALAAANTWTGQVLVVLSGDTLKIKQGKLERVVRLAGVDAPHLGQPFGQESQRFVHGLAQGRTVTVEARGPRAARGHLASVILPDGRDLGMELVKEGLAWHDRRGASDPFLDELEKNARRDRLGLWADAMPVPPWRWRPQGR